MLKKIIPSLLWKILFLFKSLILNQEAKSLRSIDFFKNKNRVIVLGNGPSLKNDLERVVAVADEYDFVCVNNFCSSPYYVIFQPNMYVFLDRYFFDENVHADWEKQRDSTFEILSEKTNWDMTVLLPYNARKGFLESKLKNKNIKIQYANVISLADKEYRKSTRFLYNTGYFGPEAINVLIYAIYYSISAGYKEIDVYGADLSFHNDVEVDQKNNHLYMKFRHFNKEDTIEVLRRGPQKNDYETMFYMLDGQARTFKAHELLEAHARQKNIKVYNKSSNSLIDAYQRG